MKCTSVVTSTIAKVLFASLLATAAGGRTAHSQSFTFTTGSLNTARWGQTATLLNNGLVLIAGGNIGINPDEPTSDAELYDPATGTFTPTGSLNAARSAHTATLLSNGMVLMAGGQNPPFNSLDSTELYNPATGTFTVAGSLSTARYYHTATLLSNGMVLMAGGWNGGYLASAELYNPSAGTSTVTGNMSTLRAAHTATLLNNGLVLIAGGYPGDNRSDQASAELYDPATGTFTLTGSMSNGRTTHTATLLTNGVVLMAGGEYTSSGGYFASADLYNPAIGTFTPTGSLNTARASHTATLLSNGMVLMAGGYVSGGSTASAELYDPATGTFTPTGSLNTARGSHTATLLNDGMVLMAGGRNNSSMLASAELYEPATPSPPGFVLIAITPAQVYDPATNTLTLSALVQDKLYGPVTAGIFSFSLDAVQASGQLSYNSAASRWQYSGQPAQALPPGQYQVHYTIITDRGRVGTATGSVTVRPSQVTVSGTITDASNGHPISGARVALFDANALWALVVQYYLGAIPPLTTLSNSVRGPATTDSGGGYAWSDLPTGGNYTLIATAPGYVQGYLTSVEIPARSSTIVQPLSLSPVPTLLSLKTDMSALEQGITGVFEANANTIAQTAYQVNNVDGLLKNCSNDFKDCAASYLKDLAKNVWGVIAVGSAPPAPVEKGVELVVEEVFKETTKDLMLILFKGVVDKNTAQGIQDEFSTADTTNGLFPIESAEAFKSDTTMGLFTGPQNALNESSTKFTTVANQYPLNVASPERLHEIVTSVGRQLSSVPKQPVTWIVPSDPLSKIAPSDPSSHFLGLGLNSQRNTYFALSRKRADLGIDSTLLTAASVINNGAQIVALLTGQVEALPWLKALGWVTDAADIAVQVAKVHTSFLMAETFETALGQTYLDNAALAATYEDTAHFLETESAKPFYSDPKNAFTGTASLDLKLTLQLGSRVLIKYPWDHSHSHDGTLTLTNNGAPAAFRAVASTIWSDGSSVVYEGASTPAISLAGASQATLTVPFQAYGQGIFGSSHPHYVSVDIYDGPFYLQTVSQQFLLEELIFPLLRFSPAKSETTRRAHFHRGSYAAPVANRQGQLGHDALASLEGQSTSLLDATLSASNPTQTVTFQSGSGQYAADLKVFAPTSSKIAVLVTDPQGARLGYSVADGVNYSELIGSASDMGQRPVLLEVLQPPANTTYTIQVALLSPGLSGVPVQVFYEPVAQATATMVASPAELVVDVTQGNDSTLSLGVGEATGQEALTNVQASVGTLQYSGGTATLPVDGDATQALGSIPAGNQQAASWAVPYPASRPLGKYSGSVAVVSDQTAAINLPVVALVRSARDMVSLFEGTAQDANSVTEKTLTIGSNGTASTWVHVPAGFGVIYAALGVVGSSANVLDPSIDIGGDGTIDWSYSGTLNFGVMADNLEGPFNAYLNSNPPGPTGWDVPIVVTAPAGETVLLNGIQVYLDHSFDSASAASLFLGTHVIGTSTSATALTISNNGSLSPEISGITLAGANSGDFSQNNDCPIAPNLLAFGTSCTVNVTFTPTAAGPRKTSLQVAYTAGGKPQTVILMGVGTAANLSPASLTFSGQTVGIASTPQVVTLTNAGTGLMNIWQTAFLGINASDFTKISTCGTTLGAGASCTISVTFTPGSEGTRTASLLVSDDGGGSPQGVALTGTGVASGSPSSSQTTSGAAGTSTTGTLTSTTPSSPTSGPAGRARAEVAFNGLSASALSFGEQEVGTSSAPQSIVFINTEKTPLTIGKIEVSGSGQGDFELTNTCGASLEGGKSCTLQITFTPHESGARKAMITIEEDAPGGPQHVPLEGVGVLPEGGRQ